MPNFDSFGTTGSRLVFLFSGTFGTTGSHRVCFFLVELRDILLTHTPHSHYHILGVLFQPIVYFLSQNPRGPILNLVLAMLFECLETSQIPTPLQTVAGNGPQMLITS